MSTGMYKSFYRYIHSFLLNKYLGTKWMNHLAGVCLTLYETGTVSKVTASSHTQQCVKVPASPHTPGTWCGHSSLWAILICVQWILMTLICVFQMAMLSIFSCVIWSLKKNPFRSFTYLLTGFSAFLLLTFYSPLYTGYIPSSDIFSASIFTQE